MITLKLYSFQKRENSTKQPAAASLTLNVTLLDNTSLMKPVFMLSLSSNPIVYNYAYVPDFNRYYFITEVSSDNNFWYLTCEEDCLASFKAQVGAESHYVLRSASEYDGSISDVVYPSNTDISTVLNYSNASGDIDHYDPLSWDNGHSYILGIVGTTDYYYDQVGSLVYYQLDDQALRKFIKYLSENIDEWSNLQGEYTEGVQKALINPIQYIKCAYAVPVAPPTIGTRRTIKFGYYTYTGGENDLIKPIGYNKTLVKETAYINIPTHPQASDRGAYLNCQPYATYTLHYGPWGDIPLDPLMVKGNTKIKLDITYDLLTGSGRLIVRGNEYPHRVFFNGSAKVSVDINLSQIYKDALGYEQATTNGIFGSVAGGIAAGLNPAELPIALGNITNSVQSMTRLNYPTVQGVGTGGSYMPFFDNQSLYLLAKFNKIVDENLEEHGRPLCQIKQINTLSGYILCENADCTITGTKEEANKINDFLNGGFFYE